VAEAVQIWRVALSLTWLDPEDLPQYRRPRRSVTKALWTLSIATLARPDAVVGAGMICVGPLVISPEGKPLRFATTLSVGDCDGDGYGDLALGAFEASAGERVLIYRGDRMDRLVDRLPQTLPNTSI
jgi:hypothetical protein